MENQVAEQVFSNETIELKVSRKPHCFVEFFVKASAALVKKAQQSAIKAVAKDTTIPGFRKGKAPDNLILKNFPKAVEEKWQKFTAEEAFKESEKLAKIPLLSNDARITFDMKSFDAENGSEMSFSFESEPSVPHIDYNQLDLEVLPEQEVAQEKLEETLKRIRLFFSTWQQVKDRPVQEGDFIIVDIDVLEEEGEKRAFSNTRLEVSKTGMAQWMYKIVIGMNTGEEKEGISEPDADSPEEEKKVFKPKGVKVIIKTIEEPVLPPVNDDLAKKVGVDSAEIMKSRLKTLLEKQTEETKQKEYREALCEQLLEKFSFDLPLSLVKKEVEFRTSQNLKNAAYKDFFKNLSADERKQEEAKVKEQAEEALRLFYLCKKIAQENKISITDNDLNQKVETTLDAMFADRDLLNPNKSDQQKALLMSRVLLSKSQDFLIKKILEKKKSK